jgi:hypothetical protein
MSWVKTAVMAVARWAGADAVKQTVVRIAATLLITTALRALSRRSQGGAGATGVEQARQYGGNVPRTVALGRTIVYGAEGAFWASGDANDNKRNTRVILVSSWPCRARAVWWEGKQLTFDGDINGGWWACQQFRGKKNEIRMWARFLTGDWEQTADSALIAEANANAGWGSDDRLRGCAALLIRRDYDPDAFPSGAPDNGKFAVEVDSAPVFDWRDPTQSLADVRTWKPSENPVVLTEFALCLARAPAQFSPGSTDPIVGPGLAYARRPRAKLTAMANICDAIVDDEARYRAGGVIRSDMTGRDIIDRFAAACDGDWVSSVAGGYLRPGHVPTPTLDIPSGALSAQAADTYDPWARPDAAINTIIAQHPDPNAGWEVVDLPAATDAAWRVEDGGVLSETLDLSFVPYRSQAWRIATRRVRQRRLQGARTLVGPHWLIEVEAGDTVTAPDSGLPYAADTWWEIRSHTRNAHAEGLTVSVQLAQVHPSVDAAAPAIGSPVPFDPPDGLRALAAPPVDVAVRVVSTGGERRSEITFKIPDTATQLQGKFQLQGPASANTTGALAAAQLQVFDVYRDLLASPPVLVGWYRWRSAGVDVQGAAGPWSAWSSGFEVAALSIAGDSAALGGVPAATIIANLNAAVSDGVYGRDEKRDGNPGIFEVVNAQSALSAQATTFGLTAQRDAFNAAMTTLNNLLATLTAPVLWSNQGDVTNIADPAAFSSAITGAFNSYAALRTACNAEAARRGEWDLVTGTEISTRPGRNLVVGGLPFFDADWPNRALAGWTSTTVGWGVTANNYVGEAAVSRSWSSASALSEQLITAAIPCAGAPKVSFRLKMLLNCANITAGAPVCYVVFYSDLAGTAAIITSNAVTFGQTGPLGDGRNGAPDPRNNAFWWLWHDGITVPGGTQSVRLVAISAGGLSSPVFLELGVDHVKLEIGARATSWSDEASEILLLQRATEAATAPANPRNGDVWIDTSTSAKVSRTRIGGAWVAAANLVTNTNQVTDGANLGGTANYSGLTGTPAASIANATLEPIIQATASGVSLTSPMNAGLIPIMTAPPSMYGMTSFTENWNGTRFGLASNISVVDVGGTVGRVLRWTGGGSTSYTNPHAVIEIRAGRTYRARTYWRVVNAPGGWNVQGHAIINVYAATGALLGVMSPPSWFTPTSTAWIFSAHQVTTEQIIAAFPTASRITCNHVLFSPTVGAQADMASWMLDDPSEDLAFDASGKMNNTLLGLPLSSLLGTSTTIQPPSPLSSTSTTTITVLATTISFGGGQTINAPARTITGLNTGQLYEVFYDRQTDTYGAYTGLPTISFYRNDTNRYISMGPQAVMLSGGSFPAPPTRPGGGGGGFYNGDFGIV